MSGTASDVTEPLRVSQLDAAELDSEVHQLMKNQFKKVIKYLKPGTLSSIEPELNSALRLIIWKFSLYDWGSTVGQHILDLKYKAESTSSSKTHWINSTQKWLYCLAAVGVPWARERFLDRGALPVQDSIKQQIYKVLHWTEVVWKCASLVNFLVFLQQGKYQSLLERLLGIRPVFQQQQMIRQVSFEYMSRELLWHGFAEFLFFLLPLVNFRNIKSYLTQKISGKKSRASLQSFRCKADYEKCVICEQWPTSPQEIGCVHVFCYYCIMSNYKAVASFFCPECQHQVEGAESIQPVRVQIS